MTGTLSRARFSDACALVEAEGRALDGALVARRFKGGGADAVRAALAAYQNVDGGFGHGLEPDLATPASTAIATSVGLRTLFELGAGADDPMVQGAFGWLDTHIDKPAGVWPIISEEVDLAPHAPWWNWSDDLAENWNGFRYNASAELLAYLYAWPTPIARDALAFANAGFRRTLAEGAPIEGAYDLKCAVRLAESSGLPGDMRRPLLDLILRSIAAHDGSDVHLAVLELAPKPESILAEPLSDQVGPALDALIAAQEDDGGWPLFWEWSYVDAAAWSKARRDWRGSLAREALERLSAWGRVAAA